VRFKLEVSISPAVELYNEINTSERFVPLNSTLTFILFVNNVELFNSVGVIKLIDGRALAKFIQNNKRTIIDNTLIFIFIWRMVLTLSKLPNL
jgi:hypothetical protein